MRLAGRVCVGVLVGVTALAGCSSGGDPAGEASTASPAAAPAEDAAAVDTTEPGSVLDLGDEATVPWRAAPELEGVLELSVDAVREGRVRDFEDLVAAGAVEGAQPYYVDVTLTNAGDSDLGGLGVPLYLRDTSDTLGPPWGFEEPFTPCRSRPLPEVVRPGRHHPHVPGLLRPGRGGVRRDGLPAEPRPGGHHLDRRGDPPAGDRADRPSRRRR